MATGPAAATSSQAHHLGAIALADAVDQGPPLGKLLGRGRWRLDCHGGRLAHANSLSTVQLGPQPAPHNCADALAVTDSQPPRKGVLRIFV